MQTFNEKYSKLCKQYGVAWNTESPKFIGETLQSLKEKYRADPHLNNTPLRLWDSLAHGFLMYNRHTGLSLSEAVCMQKYAAIRMLLNN